MRDTQAGSGERDSVAAGRISSSEGNTRDNVLVGVVGEGDDVASSNHSSACSGQRDYRLTNGERGSGRGGARHCASSRTNNLCGLAEREAVKVAELTLTEQRSVAAFVDLEKVREAANRNAASGGQNSVTVASRCAVVIKDFLSLREVTDKRSGVCRCAESAGGTSRSGGGNVGLDLVDSRAKSLGDLILLNGQVAWAFIHSHDVFTRPREAIEAGLRDRQRLVADALVERGRNSHRWRDVGTG